MQLPPPLHLVMRVRRSVERNVSAVLHSQFVAIVHGHPPIIWNMFDGNGERVRCVRVVGVNGLPARPQALGHGSIYLASSSPAPLVSTRGTLFRHSASCVLLQSEAVTTTCGTDLRIATGPDERHLDRRMMILRHEIAACVWRIRATSADATFPQAQQVRLARVPAGLLPKWAQHY